MAYLLMGALFDAHVIELIRSAGISFVNGQFFNTCLRHLRVRFHKSHLVSSKKRKKYIQNNTYSLYDINNNDAKTRS